MPLKTPPSLLRLHDAVYDYGTLLIICGFPRRWKSGRSPKTIYLNKSGHLCDVYRKRRLLLLTFKTNPPGFPGGLVLKVKSKDLTPFPLHPLAVLAAGFGFGCPSSGPDQFCADP